MKKPTNELTEFLSILPAVLYEYVVYEDDSADSAFLFFTPNCEEVLGFPEDYLLADMNHFWNRVHPEDVSRLIEDSDTARRAGRLFWSDVRWLRPDAREIWIRLSSTPTKAKSRSDYIWAGYIIDITEQKLVESQLGDSQSRYKRLVENLGEQFVVFSESLDSKKLLYVSGGFESIFGLAESSVLGKNLWKAVDWHPETLKSLDDSYRKLMSGDEAHQRLECTFNHPSGLVRHVNVTNHVAKDEGSSWFIEGIIENITYKKETELKLQQAATHDSLTGLLNRQQLFSNLDQEYQRAKRYSHSLSVLMLDLDHFKRVNDEYGHPAGDQVLSAFAEVLVNAMRESDFAGRYGGEEFLVVLPETSIDEATEFAERIRSTVENLVIRHGNQGIGVTSSIGLASLDPSCDSAKNLVALADQAVYRAKADGRNRVAVFNSPQ